MATTLLRARVDRGQAAAAKKILAGLGLKPGDAVGMLLAQVVAHRGLPFPVQEEGYAYARSEYGLTPREVRVLEIGFVGRTGGEKDHARLFAVVDGRELFEGDAEATEEFVESLDGGAVAIKLPAGWETKTVEFVAQVEDLEVSPVRRATSVHTVDSRIGRPRRSRRTSVSRFASSRE